MTGFAAVLFLSCFYRGISLNGNNGNRHRIPVEVRGISILSRKGLNAPGWGQLTDLQFEAEALRDAARQAADRHRATREACTGILPPNATPSVGSEPQILRIPKSYQGSNLT